MVTRATRGPALPIFVAFAAAVASVSFFLPPPWGAENRNPLLLVAMWGLCALVILVWFNARSPPRGS